MRTVYAIVIVCVLAMTAAADDDVIGPPTPRSGLTDTGNTYQLSDDRDSGKAMVGPLVLEREAPATRSLLSWVRLLLVVTP